MLTFPQSTHRIDFFRDSNAFYVADCAINFWTLLLSEGGNSSLSNYALAVNGDEN